MTLLNRVSLFFLAALAVCLAGYSVLSYSLIRNHLYRQFDQQLQSSLNALVAAVEVESDGVKWQPADHTIALGDEQGADDLRWIIVDSHGRLVDTSRNLNDPTADDAALRELALDLSRNPATTFHSWRLLQKRLSASQPKPGTEMEPDEFAEVVVIVARRTGDLHADLWKLTCLVGGLPAVLWLLAAVVGRGYCRRALAPLGAMARRAQSMTGADFQLRLPVAPRRDELANLSAAFNGLLDQLQQAFDKQRRFTGDAAHQLRTPLTVLRGEIDVALRRPRTDAEYRHVLVTLRGQTDELQQIVEALLFLARADGESSLPERDVVVLADWLPQHLTGWREHPRAKDLVHDIDPASRVITSPPLLGQALDNLLGNALKYSPDGSPIAVRVSQENDVVAIAVEDSGMGVAEEERRAIFEPFYRSAEARQSGAEGTGLGLTLVARIAKALGGRVDCQPRTPRGSRFTLHVPSANDSTECASPDGAVHHWS